MPAACPSARSDEICLANAAPEFTTWMEKHVVLTDSPRDSITLREIKAVYRDEQHKPVALEYFPRLAIEWFSAHPRIGWRKSWTENGCTVNNMGRYARLRYSDESSQEQLSGEEDDQEEEEACSGADE